MRREWCGAAIEREDENMDKEICMIRKNSKKDIFRYMISLLMVIMLWEIPWGVSKCEAASSKKLDTSKGCPAYLLYTDENGEWANTSLRKENGGEDGIGKDTLVTGNGTYTVSLSKSDFKIKPENDARGASVLGINIVGMAQTDLFDASEAFISEVEVKCDGKVYQTDCARMYEGDIDVTGDYQLEICNVSGYQDGAFYTYTEFSQNGDFSFSNTLSITFKIQGIKKGITDRNAFIDSQGKPIVDTAGNTAVVVGSEEKKGEIKNLKARNVYEKQGIYYRKAVQLSWETDGSEDGVVIYRKLGTNGKIKLLKMIKWTDSFEYKDRTVKMGEKYVYQIKPMIYEDSGYREMGNSKTITITVKKGLSKPCATVYSDKKHMTLLFKRVEGEKFETQYRWNDEKKWKKQTKIQGSLKNKIVRKLNAKGFILRVRSYTVINGKKTYSKWSSPMKI